MPSRNIYIDFLRFIGLSLIILAHVHAPNIIHQIRCCDVPIMLFVSGLAYGKRNIEPPLKHFYIPRIKKLLIPVYLFVVCDIIAFLIIRKLLTPESIVKSFFLCTDGAVGYVWIFKVFLLITLVTPLIVKINHKIKTSLFWFIMIVLFLSQELIVLISCNITIEPWKSIFQETIPYLVGYSIPFWMGLRLRQTEMKEENCSIMILGLCTLAALVVYIINYGTSIAITPFYKYPPHSYFIIYGLIVPVLLWKMRLILKKTAEKRLFLFIGQNTTWIYLWHIVFVSFANILIDNWILKYIMVYALALLFYWLQYNSINKLNKKHHIKLLKYFIG